VRRVFASPRLENVERVAQLLHEAGIETRITHGRSYKGGLRGDFSYQDHTRNEPIPAVWVVKSEDQPVAREILRGSGLLDSTRMDTGYSLPMFRSEEPAAVDDPGRKRAFRLKVGLLLAIAVVIALAFVAQRKPQPATPAPAAVPALAAGVSPTPDALAVAVLAGELPTRAGQSVCLSIDGHDPASSLLAMLPATPGAVLPASQCAAQPQLAIGSYRATASGNGSIVLERRRNNTAPPVVDTYDVYRTASGWRVIEPYQP
jgi:hypothetical protein